MVKQSNNNVEFKKYVKRYKQVFKDICNELKNLIPSSPTLVLRFVYEISMFKLVKSRVSLDDYCLNKKMKSENNQS